MFFDKWKVYFRSIFVSFRINKLIKQNPIYFDVPIKDKDNFFADTIVSQKHEKSIFELKPVIFKIRDNGKIKIKSLVIRAGSYISARGSGYIEFGDDCFVNTNCTFISRASIVIGNGFMCSDNVYIRDNDGHFLEVDNKQILPKSIKIGNNVWVGRDVIILKGVTIGDNVVIGAGSIVTKDISSNCIAAGNPAKIIKKPKMLIWSKSSNKDIIHNKSSKVY